MLAVAVAPARAADESTQASKSQQGAQAASADVTADKIIVTARKRDETVLDIPVDVSAVTQAQMDRMGVNDLDNLSNHIAGFDFSNNDSVTPLIRFRGLEAVYNTPAARTGAVFWDGAYVSDGVSVLPLYDLQRVEVIKGPQTAFFGRNTFSGAVNFIPQEPGDFWTGKLMASYSPSNQDSYNVTAAAGGPLSDKIGVRLAGMSETIGADWYFANGDPNGEKKIKSVMSTLVFKPTEDLKIKATGFYADATDTTTAQSQSATTAAGDCHDTYSGNLRDVVTGQIVGSFSTDLSQSPRAFFCRAFPSWGTFRPT